MEIAVCVKQVPDTETRPRIDEGGTGIQQEGIKWIVNPYDEFAIEEALQLTEKYGGEVTIISLGSIEIEPTIRSAIAMGAQKAIRIDTTATPFDSLIIAKALAQVLKEGNYDLIFFGKQAIDNDNSQIPQMVGEALKFPCATSVTKLKLQSKRISAEREIEGGKEIVTFNLPGIISTHKGLNVPRYRSLKGIMKAKKIPIEVIKIKIDKENISVQKLEYPPAKKAGKILGEGVAAVSELVRLLHDDAKVI